MRLNTGSKRIADIGEAAGVKVGETTKAESRFASAHDLRQAFGLRWSTRVMPPDLKELMRHANIETTMQFYVVRNAEATADAVWSGFAAQSTKHAVATPAVRAKEKAANRITVAASKVPPEGLEPSTY